MLTMLCLLFQTLTFSMVGWAIWQYIRATHKLSILVRAMNCDEVIDKLLDDSAVDHQPAEDSADVSKKRERLAALAAGGEAHTYLGKATTVEQIDKASDKEIEKLYVRYESRLGALMTRTLRAAALQLYATAAEAVLPIENKTALLADLETDPFVGHALGSAACVLYHHYGMYLAPLTIALTTAKHCRFEERNDKTCENGKQGDEKPQEGCSGESLCSSQKS
jgi:hypothetical protein